MRCKSERPLIFDHAILMKTPGVCQAKDIRKRISTRTEFGEKVQNKDLVG